MKSVKYFVVFLFTIVLLGCAGGPVQRATKFTSYDDFKPGPDGGIDLVWARAGLRTSEKMMRKLNEYDSVVIDQIFVVAGEDSLDEGEIQELTDFMINALEEKLSPFTSIVDEPTGNTLRLSIALSNVETPNPVLAITSSVLPFGIAMSTISKITTGEHTNVGSASIELLVSDAQNGTPIFAAIDRHAGNKDFSTMIDSLDDAKDAISFWVERLGVTLNQPELL